MAVPEEMREAVLLYRAPALIQSTVSMDPILSLNVYEEAAKLAENPMRSARKSSWIVGTIISGVVSKRLWNSATLSLVSKKRMFVQKLCLRVIFLTTRKFRWVSGRYSSPDTGYLFGLNSLFLFS